MKLIVTDDNGSPKLEVVSKEQYEEHWLQRCCDEAVNILQEDLVSPEKIKVFKRHCKMAGMPYIEVLQIAAHIIEMEEGE